MTNLAANKINKTTQPPTEEEIRDLKVQDYSESLTNVAKQLHILEHAMPLNKIEEIEAAYTSMRASIGQLHIFLTIRGFDI